jgi:hypothetical protein
MMTQHLKTFAQNVLPNTFIGGVAATINTPQLLANVLRIHVNRINNFRIINNNIQCKITGNYTGPTRAFFNVGLTYYIDTDNLITTLNSNYIAWNPIPKLVLNGVLYAEPTSLVGNEYLTELEVPNLLEIRGAHFINVCPIKILDIPKCTYIAPQGLAHTSINTPKYTYINIRMCKNLGNSPLNTNVFQNINSSVVIDANIYLATNNNGGADGDLVYAKNRGCQINFYTDNGNYVSTL